WRRRKEVRDARCGGVVGKRAFLQFWARCLTWGGGESTWLSGPIHHWVFSARQLPAAPEGEDEGGEGEGDPGGCVGLGFHPWGTRHLPSWGELRRSPVALRLDLEIPSNKVSAIRTMGGEIIAEMDMEVLPSMWPECLGNEAKKQFNIDNPGMDNDMLEEVTINDDSSIVDFKRLIELTNYSEKGSSQLSHLLKHWEYKQANALRLLKEEFDNLSKQKHEAELKKLEILEAHRFEGEKYGGDKRSVSILDEVFDLWDATPSGRKIDVIYSRNFEIDAEYGTVRYWKERAAQLESMLEASAKRELMLMEKLQDSIKNLERQSSPVEELTHMLKRADNFLHFVLQHAPVVIGHQDKDLRYRFIYNNFPTLAEQDIIGKTDVEIFTGSGVKESQEFKKEVLERGLPAKREITFETELFGSKTFLIYVEPVFSKAGDKIGVNYVGMEVTDQVIKREKMAQLREEFAVQKAKEKELNKTIHITEETMRAKQMLATMSHEIRSPLTGVVSMAEILANTTLDKEQRQLLDVMLSSGDLVLQLINDILDLSKVESGVMKLEATRFRPREVVKHVLQTAAASLQKELILEGHVTEDVPLEVIGDVLRIRQILTNLISNAIKFTHEGKVGINLHVVSENCLGCVKESPQILTDECSATQMIIKQEHGSVLEGHYQQGMSDCQKHTENEQCNTPVKGTSASDEDTQGYHQLQEETVWICCDVYDTGIGIPEKALPNLFKKYMQASAAHARKYGGTGLGLAICKQLVELMGGRLTVTSKEKCGSTFTFVLPCKVVQKPEPSDDSDDVSCITDHEALSDSGVTGKSCEFQFKSRAQTALLSSGRSTVLTKHLLLDNGSFGASKKLNGFLQESVSSPSSNGVSRKMSSVQDTCSVSGSTEQSSGLEVPVHHGPEKNIKIASGKVAQYQNANTGFMMNRFHSPSTGSRATHNISSSEDRMTAHMEAAEMDEESCSSKTSAESPSNGKADENPAISRICPMTIETKHQPKILLVEDNRINVMVTQSMMKQLGHSIDVVNNGLEAIRAVQDSSYDLILMDVCMPVMDGLQATRLIRSFEETGNWDAAVEAGIDKDTLAVYSPATVLDPGICRKRISIIAMTANALAESAAECLANGMDSFVSKPVTFQKLKQCLQQHLPC
ncbi:hypothetical protein Taro_031250, partial [Colocasia esculenta]|nr:hypothetical protein [Colocasia esculenta]